MRKKRILHAGSLALLSIPLALFLALANDVAHQPVSLSLFAAFFSPDMVIESTAFDHEGTMPAGYTCSGEDVSPPLQFQNIPQAAESLTLIVEDPDAQGGVFVHWIVWNIPPSTASLSEDVKPEGREGKNDFGKTGYGGPCPPRGVHRYFFRLYALDTILELPEDSTVEELRDAMTGHIIAEAVLMVRYGRGSKPSLLIIASAALVGFSALALLVAMHMRAGTRGKALPSEQ